MHETRLWNILQMIGRREEKQTWWGYNGTNSMRVNGAEAVIRHAGTYNSPDGCDFFEKR